MESMVNQGEIQAVIFLAICQILKLYVTLMISHLSYIEIVHKAMLVSSDKRSSSRGQRPLSLFISNFQQYVENGWS